MPSNTDFTVSILIAGVSVPEYEKDGEYFVECNLNTPLTYREGVTEIVQGVKETQEYPVTPYHIKVTAHSSGENPHYFRVMVDGIKVKGVSLAVGQSKVVRGFRDGPCVRELLFSMPRFARDELDRLIPERQASIGKIEVQCWSASHKNRKLGLHYKQLQFQQANKKDSTSVTNGQYIMATSRAGRKVCPRSLVRSVDSWKLEAMQSSITVTYHMPHTLRDLGFTLRPLDLISEILSQTAGEVSMLQLKREGGLMRGGMVSKKRSRKGVRDGSGSIVGGDESGGNSQGQNPQEAAEALLALFRGTGSDDLKDAPGKIKATSGTTAGSASASFCKCSTVDSETEEEAADNDEMDIVEVWQGTPTKKSKKSTPLVDLTMDSDAEDAERPKQKLEGIDFDIKPEVKNETPHPSEVAIEESALKDSGVMSSVDVTSQGSTVPSQGAVVTPKGVSADVTSHDASNVCGKVGREVEVHSEVPRKEVKRDTIVEEDSEHANSGLPMPTEQVNVNTTS